ncbi:MAG: hypothetical protein OEM52_07390 [bacterium]|nr:hypothetical protein [bacterium]
MNINLSDELNRIQSVFDEFMRVGSWIMVEFNKDDAFDLDIGCFYKVLKVKPGFDAAGNLIDTDFWLLFCTSGYEEDGHHGHVKKILDMTDTEFGVDLQTFDGETLHIERIVSGVDLQHEERWRLFQQLISENPVRYAELNSAYVEEGLRRMDDV